MFDSTPVGCPTSQYRPRQDAASSSLLIAPPPTDACRGHSLMLPLGALDRSSSTGWAAWGGSGGGGRGAEKGTGACFHSLCVPMPAEADIRRELTFGRPTTPPRAPPTPHSRGPHQPASISWSGIPFTALLSLRPIFSGGGGLSVYFFSDSGERRVGPVIPVRDQP